MPGTFTSELAREGGDWWAWCEFGGWGRRLGANAAENQDPFRWSTLDPVDHGYSAAVAGRPFVPGLVLPPDIIAETIDLRTGRTSLGDFQPTILDPPQPTSGSPGYNTTDLLTDLLAVEGQVDTSGPWDLDSDVTAAATTWTLVDRTGIVTGMVLHLGAEAVMVTDATPAGPQDIDVERAFYNTDAVAHSTRDNGGEGRIYDHPRFVRGRDVRLYVNLFDERTGLALPVAQAKLAWRGTVDDWEMADSNTFRFACRPSLGAIDRTLGRRQFNSAAVEGVRTPGATAAGNRRMDVDAERVVLVAVPEPVAGIPVADPQYDYTGAGDDRRQEFYARLGPNVVEARYNRASGDPPSGRYRIVAHGLRPYGLRHETPQDVSLPFRDVLITHPNPHRLPVPSPLRFFTLGGSSTQHPVDIMLALITSTGAGTNGDWDTLPAHWGAGVAQSRINLARFREARGRSGFLTLPGAVLGWDGRPFRLREWLEAEILGPLGWFLYLDHDGLISLGEVRDAYNTASLPTITEADIADSPPATMLGALDESTTWTTWQYGWDPRTDEFGALLRSRAPEGEERYPDEPTEIGFAVKGLGVGADADAAIHARAATYARRWHTPLPRVRLSLGLHRLDLDVTDGVLLTVSTLPNPFTRSRGLTAEPAVVIARAFNPGQGTLDLELMLTGTPNVGLWAPAGTVSAYAAGPPPVVTLNANDHSRDLEGGEVPARDALGFANGDSVMLLDSALQVRSDTVVTIAVAPETDGANTIRLSGKFQSGGGPISPNADDVVCYVHYESGATPAAAWSASMLRHVAQANDADDLFPNGDAAYVYGN